MSENIGQRRLIFFQQEISLLINNLTWKEIKRTSEEMPENILFFPFQKPLSRQFQKNQFTL